MTSISLLDLFRSGQFGPIQLGRTRQEVYDLLGEPDGYGCPETYLMKAGIWLYDAIELHFSTRLWLITTDHISYPGWWGHSERIRLDAWFFSDGRQPSKSDLEDGLARLNIPYQYIELEQRFEDDVVGRLLFEISDIFSDVFIPRMIAADRSGDQAIEGPGDGAPRPVSLW
jgi:hypothetical protein